MNVPSGQSVIHFPLYKYKGLLSSLLKQLKQFSSEDPLHVLQDISHRSNIFLSSSKNQLEWLLITSSLV